MREALPVVWWKAVCYHYVRRTRQVTRYRNGDAFTTTQVYYERVNSHTAGSAFNFSRCGVKDVSRTLVNVEGYPATKVKFTKGFSFATVEAENEFEDQRSQFFQDHERRDDYMETREGLDLLNVNFKEYMIAFADPDNLPWYVSHIVFWVASVFLMSWPLRVLIEFKTAYVHYHVQKLFGSNYMDPSYAPPGGQMSRVSTMGSSELEMNIRNNYTIVPSYSEALLMEAANGYTPVDANGNITPNGLPPHSCIANGSVTSNGHVGVVSRSLSNGHINGSVPNGSIQNGHIPNTCRIIIQPNGTVQYANIQSRSDGSEHQEGGEEERTSGRRRKRRRRNRSRRRARSQEIHPPPADQNNSVADGSVCDTEAGGSQKRTRNRPSSYTPSSITPDSPEEPPSGGPSSPPPSPPPPPPSQPTHSVTVHLEESATQTSPPPPPPGGATTTPSGESPPSYEVALTMRVATGDSDSQEATQNDREPPRVTGSTPAARRVEEQDQPEDILPFRCMETSL